MKFGSVPLSEAAGAILAHSLALPNARFRKGRILSTADVDQLQAASISEVTVACLEPGDIHEDEAATMLADAAVGDGVRIAAAFTGRANLIANIDGLAILDVSRVRAVNAVDEAVTLATVPPYTVVRARQILATVKIIPFAAPGGAVRAAAAHAAKGEPLVRVAEFRDRPVGLVQTTAESLHTKVLDKTTRTVSDRLERYGAHLEREIRCPHDERDVAEAITQLVREGCTPVLVIGASAIVDRRDVIPAAIERAGGEVDRFGMPVDPGNLLLLAHHGNVPVVGAPGCARSSKFNGFDHVLTRLLAGIPVDAENVGTMGAGGLLSELAARPQPRAAAAKTPEVPRVAALVLAGGMSRRTGKANKLLATLNGTAMVAHVADTVLATSAHPVVIVTGHEAVAVEAALSGRDVTFAHNPRFAEGLSTSLRQGLTALEEMNFPADGVLVCLGDMPRLQTHQLEKLISAFSPDDGRSVCVPTFNGQRGNPVLWGRTVFSEIENVSGDVGARHLIGEYEDTVCEVAMDNDAIFIDVDTPEAMAAVGASPAAKVG